MTPPHKRIPLLLSLSSSLAQHYDYAIDSLRLRERTKHTTTDLVAFFNLVEACALRREIPPTADIPRLFTQISDYLHLDVSDMKEEVYLAALKCLISVLLAGIKVDCNLRKKKLAIRLVAFADSDIWSGELKSAAILALSWLFAKEKRVSADVEQLSLESKILSWAASTDRSVTDSAAVLFARVIIANGDNEAIPNLCSHVLDVLNEKERLEYEHEEACSLRGMLKCLGTSLQLNSHLKLPIGLMVHVALSTASCYSRQNQTQSQTHDSDADGDYRLTLASIEQAGLILLGQLCESLGSLIFPYVSSLCNILRDLLLHQRNRSESGELWKVIYYLYKTVGTGGVSHNVLKLGKNILEATSSSSFYLNALHAIASSIGPLIPASQWLKALNKLISMGEIETASHICLACGGEVEATFLPIIMQMQSEYSCVSVVIERVVHPSNAGIGPPLKIRRVEIVEIEQKVKEVKEEETTEDMDMGVEVLPTSIHGAEVLDRKEKEEEEEEKETIITLPVPRVEEHGRAHEIEIEMTDSVQLPEQFRGSDDAGTNSDADADDDDDDAFLPIVTSVSK